MLTVQTIGHCSGKKTGKRPEILKILLKFAL